MKNVKQSKCKEYIGSCCGNSFVVLDCRDDKVSKEKKVEFSKKNIIKYGVDSALFLEKSKRADVCIKIFEKDGSESEFCGNGMLLISYFRKLDRGKIEMSGGIMKTVGDIKRQAILMDMKFLGSKKVNNEENCVFVKSGEPHRVYLVDDLKKIDLIEIGRNLQKKYPEGINVDAIQKLDNSCYLIKTYERGVLAETKSCGTGSLSSYVAISYFDDRIHKKPIEFRSIGGSHWVSRNKNMLKLETLKRFCKIKAL